MGFNVLSPGFKHGYSDSDNCLLTLQDLGLSASGYWLSGCGWAVEIPTALNVRFVFLSNGFRSRCLELQRSGMHLRVRRCDVRL